MADAQCMSGECMNLCLAILSGRHTSFSLLFSTVIDSLKTWPQREFLKYSHRHHPVEGCQRPWEGLMEDLDDTRNFSLN